jgi:glycosyltransferase involved in cell wall biosynthesis
MPVCQVIIATWGMDFMKILHVISSVDPKGGGPIEGMRQRGIFLRDRGHQVEVLSLDDPGAPHVAAFPLPVHAVGPARGGYAFAPRIKSWLAQHARQYDAVVISGLWQYHGWATSRVLRGLGVPYHVFTHGMLDPWFRDAYPLKHLKKYAYWLLAEHHVIKHAKAVLFTSEEERLRARLSFMPYCANEIVVAYGSSAPPAQQQALVQLFKEQHPELTGKHLLLFLGRIHEKKGCDLLIKAFAQMAVDHPNLHLIMAGPAAPDVLQGLKALADHLKIGDRITWLGMVSGEQKWGVLLASHVFCLPSHQENFGIAVAEALACGLPVLISDKVNTWREVAGDQAGFVAPDTVEGTTANLRRWLALSDAEQTDMRERAQKTFASRYTVEASAQSLLDVLENN